MTVSRAFINYLETLGIGTFGQDIFYGFARSSDVVPDSIWWIVDNGGDPEIKLQTGEYTANYSVEIYYRNRDGEDVLNKIHQLNDQLNCSGCVELEGYDTLEISTTTFPVDIDIDLEDRKVGLIQANLKIFKEC